MNKTMTKVTPLVKTVKIDFPAECAKGRRHLSDSEINILKKTNTNRDDTWQNILVPEEKDAFDADLVRGNEFSGFVIFGRTTPVLLKYHDLDLMAGVYNSYLQDVVLGDDCVVRNVKYFCNYRTAERVILFNIQEISCTYHSKFGNGILKEGEKESDRIWIGVGNENDKRAVLPFEDMIPADAFIWSRYKDDELLQQRFMEMTERGNTKKLDTYGIIESDAVIKNTTLLKDAKIGSNCYIKGAFKLKNITILSSADEPSQVGEGVELVNGILGYGSKVFYQAVAVRFVIGRNCQLKYGARLLNSVLGDNSTVSCCELLNNLIFPFHEQHHNSSFLIASTVCGQSNIASGATIGSNHNSRSPDGEMLAGRGFWPGLGSDFKFNSRFASFSLISKGSYQNELNIQYPFALVAYDGPCRPIHIIPAYWFLYNMYAISRNKSKFQKRDKRKVKVQHIETDPLAPDTIQEVVEGLQRIIILTADYLVSKKDGKALSAITNADELYQVAKDYLHQNPDSTITLNDPISQKKYGAVIFKPVKAYKEYRKVVKYFAVSVLMDWCKKNKKKSLESSDFAAIKELVLYRKWVNVGGQVIPEAKLEELFLRIKDTSVKTWKQVHQFYDECQKMYDSYKASYSIYLLEYLYSRKIEEFTDDIWEDIKADVLLISNEMYNSALTSRMKDYDDEFRMITFRNAREMNAVLSSIVDNEFLGEMKKSTQAFDKALEPLFAKLIAEK